MVKVKTPHVPTVQCAMIRTNGSVCHNAAMKERLMCYNHRAVQVCMICKRLHSGAHFPNHFSIMDYEASLTAKGEAFCR